MDVALIEMPPEVAKDKLKTYRRALHRRADVEYERIARGLEALADGTPLIQLSRVFVDCPRDAKGRPKLAIARADRRRVQYSNWGRADWEHSFNSAYNQRSGATARDSLVCIADPAVRHPHIRGYALVPIVPPDVRSTRDLSRFFTLWEVERWADESREVGPDIDPFLLKRIDADLYAVVGSWDLTPLEQAILAGRKAEA